MFFIKKEVEVMTASNTQIEWPKISIITPCYNHEKYIGSTIESIVSQGYPNLEYIVIDDGSTDDSAKIIQSFGSRVTRIETLTGYRKTPTIAINQGFNLSKGEILGWISSDDLLLPKSLFSLARIFTDLPQVNWLTGMATTINQEGEPIDVRRPMKNKYDFATGNWAVLQQESTFFRRSLWNKAGSKLNENLRYAYDTYLWQNFFQTDEIYHATCYLGAFRKGLQSRTISNPEPILKEHQRVARKIKSSFSRKDRLLTHVYSTVNRPLLRPVFRQTGLFYYHSVEYDVNLRKWVTKKKAAPIA